MGDDGRAVAGGGGENDSILRMKKAHLGLFYDQQYFDLADWLADQTPVEVRLTKVAPFAGSLDKGARARGERHLPVGSKITVPIAAAALLVKKDLVELVPPLCFSENVLQNLRENPCIVNLRKLSPQFFELGSKVAQITGDSELAEALFATFQQRTAQLIRSTLEASDEGAKQRGESGSGSGGSKSGVVGRAVELDVFLAGLTNSEQHIRERLIQQQTPSDGRPLAFLS